MTDIPDHGIKRYRSTLHRCRCEVCRAANRDRQREYRELQRAKDAPAESTELTPPPLREPSRNGDRLVLDLDATPGAIEKALDQDIADPAGEVLWKNTLVALATYNAKLLDQLASHERFDIISPVQLRTLEILNRLAYMKVGEKVGGTAPAGGNDGEETEEQRTARVLAELQNG